MRSSRVLSLLLSVYLCFSIALFPAAAAGNVWSIDDLEADPRQELEEIKGSGPVMDQTAVMSVYDVDEDTAMYALSMMAVDVASEEGETVDSVSGPDFFSLLSTDQLVSALFDVYYPSETVAGIVVPAYNVKRPYPDDGMSFSKHTAGNGSVLFASPVLSYPETLHDGEVQSCLGFIFPPLVSDQSHQYIDFNIDLSSFESFSSFEFSGSLNVLSGFRTSTWGSELADFKPESVAVVCNGAVIRTFYLTDLGTFDFGLFSFSSSSPVNSLSLRFYYPQTSLPSFDSDFCCRIYFHANSTVSFAADIDEVTFRKQVTSGISNIFQGILELPGKIVSLLIDGLKSLFIPSEDDMTSLTGKYQQLLSERLGFIWQAYELVRNLFTGIMDALENGGSHEFSFPGIAFPFNGEELVILPETPVSLDNELMDVIRPVLGTIVCFIAVVGFVNVAESMVIALISGVSYYEFLHGKRGGSG